MSMCVCVCGNTCTHKPILLSLAFIFVFVFYFSTKVCVLQAVKSKAAPSKIFYYFLWYFWGSFCLHVWVCVCALSYASVSDYDASTQIPVSSISRTNLDPLSELAIK